MHSLMHLPKCVEDLGTLWVYSCFPFENVNGHLMEKNQDRNSDAFQYLK
jgi:hypothetical protein